MLMWRHYNGTALPSVFFSFSDFNSLDSLDSVSGKIYHAMKCFEVIHLNLLIVTCRLCVISVREDNDSNVKIIVTWFKLTSISAEKGR